VEEWRCESHFFHACGQLVPGLQALVVKSGDDNYFAFIDASLAQNASEFVQVADEVLFLELPEAPRIYAFDFVKTLERIEHKNLIPM